MPKIVVDPFRARPKQREFFRLCALPFSECEEVLFDGSIRGGKTQACVKVIVAWAMKYGGTYVISRFSYRELEDSTKKVCLYGEAGMPPSIPPELMRGGRLETAKNETHNKVTLANGAEILFRALEPKERGKIRNLTAAGWFIDQAEELDGEDIADFYQEIKGRCSDPRAPRKVLLAANPGPTDHFVYRRFVDPDTRYRRTRRIHVTLIDNAEVLPKDYVDMQLATQETNPGYYARMVMGQWGSFGGKRFKVWDPKLHVVDPFDVPSDWTIVEGADYGWANPTCWEWFAIDFNGRWWGVAEHYANETAVPEHATAIKAIRANENLLPFRGSLDPSATWLDPSAWAKKSEHESVAVEFQQSGIRVGKAMTDRLGGWERMERFLAEKMDDGLPRLRFFRNCEWAIRQIPNLKIVPGTDDVEKRNDHSADASRYALMSQMRGPEEQTVEEQHTRVSVAKRIIDRAKSRTSEPLYTGG